MARGPMAGVSGPGKFSKRTDGLSFESTEYGSGVANAANKAGAPLAKTPDVRPTSRSEMGMAPSQITPLYAPSERADEPITAGIAMGPGPGPEIMGGTPIRIKTSDTLAKLLPFDDTGEIAILYQEALARGN
ncbi:MAG: hypothetical protein ACO3FZ_06435 [Candidatus Nanopelagicaceae bacterium]